MISQAVVRVVIPTERYVQNERFSTELDGFETFKVSGNLKALMNLERGVKVIFSLKIINGLFWKCVFSLF